MAPAVVIAVIAVIAIIAIIAILVVIAILIVLEKALHDLRHRLRHVLGQRVNVLAQRGRVQNLVLFLPLYLRIGGVRHATVRIIVLVILVLDLFEFDFFHIVTKKAVLIVVGGGTTWCVRAPE